MTFLHVFVPRLPALALETTPLDWHVIITHLTNVVVRSLCPSLTHCLNDPPHSTLMGDHLLLGGFCWLVFLVPWPELLGFAKENNVTILIRHTSYSCYLIYLGNNMWIFFPVPKNSQEIHHSSYFLITVLTTKFSCLHGWTHFYSTKNVKACGIA